MGNRDASEGMDVEGLKKARDVRAQRRELLVDKWKARVVQTQKKINMGTHQVAEVLGKPQDGGGEKEDVGQSQIGDRRCGSQKYGEGPTSKVAGIISQGKMPSRYEEEGKEDMGDII